MRWPHRVVRTSARRSVSGVASHASGLHQMLPRGGQRFHHASVDFVRAPTPLHARNSILFATVSARRAPRGRAPGVFERRSPSRRRDGPIPLRLGVSGPGSSASHAAGGGLADRCRGCAHGGTPGRQCGSDDLFRPELPHLVNARRTHAAFPMLHENLVFVVDAATSEEAGAASEALARALEQSPMFTSVLEPRGEFFEEHALLYLPLERVEDLVDELARAQPLPEWAGALPLGRLLRVADRRRRRRRSTRRCRSPRVSPP